MINRHFESNWEISFDFFNDYYDTRRYLMRVRNINAVRRLDERHNLYIKNRDNDKDSTRSNSLSSRNGGTIHHRTSR